MAQTLPSKELVLGVIAKKKNTQKEARFLTRQFAFSTSGEELMQRVHREYLANPAFRQKWSGWVFGVYITNYVFEIDENGASVLHRNDREAIA